MGKLIRKQIIHAPLKDCWEFFSKPENLKKITPGHMGFDITQFDGKAMYAGQEIHYKVSPLPGFKTTWVTRITEVKDQKEFVDLQLKGPYKRWHHRHLFQADGPDRTVMMDAIHYTLPLGIFGRIFGKKLVQKKLNEIFEFRKAAVEKLFPEQ